MEFFQRFAKAMSSLTDTNPSSPVVVHCSAGIGRSGATIAIDMLLNRIHTEGLDAEIDIPALVRYIRSQRPGKLTRRSSASRPTFFS